MKKTRIIFAFILALLLSLAVVSICVSAEDSTTEDGFTYTISNGQATVIGYTGKNTKITIPSVIEDCPVVAIGESAFSYIRASLLEVTIPEGVTTIEKKAFYEHYSLRSVSIPSTVTEILDYAFLSCTSLDTVNFPNGNNVSSIGAGAFMECKNVSEVIGDKLTKIGVRAFYNSVIPELTLPEGITTIPDEAFYRCGIEKLILPSTLQSIGTGVFEGNDIQGELVLPENLGFIGNDAFRYNDFTSVVFNERLAQIGPDAFYSCQNLVSVELPDSLSSLGAGAFRGCDSLETVKLSNRQTSLPYYSFSQCKSLKEITIPDSIQSFGTEIFLGSGSNIHVIISGGLTTNEAWFNNEQSIAKVTVGEGVTVIPAGAFLNCTNLKSVDLPSTLKSIDDKAFQNCNHLTDIEIPEGVTFLGDECLADTRIVTVTVPETVVFSTHALNTDIGWFAGCDKLETAIIKAPLNMVPPETFAFCSSLKSVELPDTIEYIGHHAFEECSSLSEFDFTGIKSIYSDAFAGTAFTELDFSEFDDIKLAGGSFAECIDLEKVILPKNLEVLSDGLFAGCEKLTDVTLPDAVTVIENSVFEMCAITSMDIPEGVTSIGDSAFAKCAYLENVSFPSTLNTIKSKAFYKCTALSEVKVPDSVTALGTNAFFECTALTKVEIGDGVTSIPSSCFANCKSLKEVKLPSTLKSIFDFAFENCTSLEALGLSDNVHHIDDGAFLNCISLKDFDFPAGLTYLGEESFYNTAITKFVCPEGLKKLEYATFAASALREIVFNENLTEIGGSAFFACENLEKVVIPDNVLKIKGNAFGSCHNLKEVEIPGSVSSIEKQAFVNCRSLEILILNEGITEIREDAFAECYALTSVVIPESVVSIEARAFCSCSALVDIDLPEHSMCAIYYNAFSGTAAYNDTASYVDGMFIIEQYLIWGDPDMVAEDIYVPEGIENTAELALAFCDLRNNLYLPSTLKYLGDDYTCYSNFLGSIFYNGTKREFMLVDRPYFDRTMWDRFVFKPEVYDLSELFINYQEKSLYEMVEFIADNQEVYYFVQYFRERTDASTNMIYFHLAGDLGSERVPDLGEVGISDSWGKYLVSTARFVNPDASMYDVLLGEVGNKVMTVELNEDFIEYINSLNRLDGNIIILDFLMNILDSEEVVGVSWSLNDIYIGGTSISAYSDTDSSIYEPAVIGDCDGDGIVTGIDGNLMRRIISGNDDKVDPFAVDLNGDGVINAKDSLALKRKIIEG